MPRRMSFDRILFVTVGLLLVGGLLVVSSASSYAGLKQTGSANHYMLRQCMFAVIGLLGMLAAMHLPYRRLADGRVVTSAIVIALVALFVVLAMPTIGGARRWIVFGPMRFQPSEFAKLAAILFTAKLLSRKEDRIHEFEAVALPLLVVLAPLVILILIEPDLGSVVMLAATVSAMVFVAGLRWRHVAFLGATCAVALSIAVLASDYRRERVLAFLDSDAAPKSSYQLDQSLVALGHGGAWGVGLGNGHQQAYFLPEAHTDFVYAVIGEEFGLLGTTVVLVAFLVVFWRGLRASMHAPDRFGSYLALGITTLLTLQALINMGVCVGLLPTKGLTLPFLSYGGSSLVVTLVATGVLLNVSQHSN